VLQLERLQRDMEEKEAKTSADKEKPLLPPRSIEAMLKVGVSSSKSKGNASTDKKRQNQWMISMKDLVRSSVLFKMI
jgi:hypothetical protein